MKTESAPCLITWNDSYSVGIPAMDLQHRRMVDFLNRLHASMAANQPEEAVEEILQGLTKYTRVHFAAEEELMRRHEYPDWDAHRRLHEQLTLDVAAYSRQRENGGVDPERLANFLKDWLLGHIIQEDRKYGSYIAGQSNAPTGSATPSAMASDAFVAWRDNLSVGIAEMDAQHRTLVDLLNELYSAMRKGEATQVADDILARLVDYTREHFRSEEQLMKKHQFPGLQEHIRQHAELMSEVTRIDRKRFAADTTEILRFLKTWLLEHILGADKEYGRFIQS